MLKKDLTFHTARIELVEDCQSSLVTLAYSYIKLQVWVLIEYNNWIATAITVLVSHHKHALKGSNFSHSENRVSRDCQSSLVTLSYSYIKLEVWVVIE